MAGGFLSQGCGVPYPHNTLHSTKVYAVLNELYRRDYGVLVISCLHPAAGNPHRQHRRRARHQQHSPLTPLLIPHTQHRKLTRALQLWTLYNRLPTPTSTSGQETKKLKLEVLRLKRDMNATSAQDDFAKWAKLRRQHDKAVAEYEEKCIYSQALHLLQKIKRP